MVMYCICSRFRFIELKKQALSRVHICISKTKVEDKIKYIPLTVRTTEKILFIA